MQDAIAHLVSCLIRKSYGQDVPWRYTLSNQISYAVCNDTGLPGTRASKHEQRSKRVPDSRVLLGIQPIGRRYRVITRRVEGKRAIHGQFYGAGLVTPQPNTDCVQTREARKEDGGPSWIRTTDLALIRGAL